MSRSPRIAFIGAGSTVFLKNIIGDVFQHRALKDSHISLMDINPGRLRDAEIVTLKIARTLGTDATASTHLDQRSALEKADFVIVAFNIGGYDPCTINDFEIPRKYGLRQTIGDTLGIGGIMRGIRTVPYLWSICEDMRELCPNAIMLQYVNPMAINMWAIANKYPDIRAVGLCHSVQGTAMELAHDLDVPIERIRYLCAGINHVAFYLEFDEVLDDGSTQSLYPRLREGYSNGHIPKPNKLNPRCPNIVRYEMMKRLGYFVTESSEHFAEYVPWFIKSSRPELIEKYQIPLDEYLARCEEQIENWEQLSQHFRESNTVEVEASLEYASDIINSVWTGEPSVVYGNVKNKGLITSLPDGCIVEVPCLVDRNGLQPVHVGELPPQLTAVIRTNLNVQELVVSALLEENFDHVYHAAMMDPHTSSELDLEQIWNLVDDLARVHETWMPEWVRQASSNVQT